MRQETHARHNAPRKLSRSVGSAAMLVALALGGASGCRVVSGPEDLHEDGIDGRWVLTLINGAPLASMSPGFDLPARSDFLRSGSLTFTSLIVWGFEDQDLLHEGNALANYGLGNAQGVAQPPASYTGGFTFDPDDKEVKLKSGGRSLTGRVNQETMTFTQQDVPLMGTVTLVFVKQVPVSVASRRSERSESRRAAAVSADFPDFNFGAP